MPVRSERTSCQSRSLAHAARTTNSGSQVAPTRINFPQIQKSKVNLGFSTSRYPVRATLTHMHTNIRTPFLCRDFWASWDRILDLLSSAFVDYRQSDLHPAEFWRPSQTEICDKPFTVPYSWSIACRHSRPIPPHHCTNKGFTTMHSVAESDFSLSLGSHSWNYFRLN